ncbi:MAG: MmcQ/YjbR family DNA-binding protein [Bacteroidetes bacterium]|nr:MmcQ/YjbR family DNA-binding protein [Bacteroidota bacterium]MBS1974310.1 MmcQ/YjbR family DNA-binding protein [Bacteroidota bacterium]
MDIEQLREYCLLKREVTEGFPFGNNTLVFKVSGKIFLIASLNQPLLQFNVKCDPERAIALREQFGAIQPGYHMNKKLWNTIIVDRTIPQKLIKEMIDDSYLLVVKSLPKKFHGVLK